MGTIQNSMNQILGSIAGAATVGKHLANQEKANELAKINATDKAIDEYVKSGEDAINNMAETEGLKRDLGAIDREQEMWANEPESPQAMAFESAKKSVENAIEAKQYQANLIKLRMQKQDERWKLLGIDKEELKVLNSPEEQKKIHEFRGGKK